MDYTKEIERLEKAQEQALLGRAPNQPLPSQPTDGAQQASTPVSAGATDAGHGVPSNAASVVSWSLLVQAGASVDMLDKYGKNALDCAEFFKKPEASDLLCSLGAKPTPLDPNPANRETSKRSNC
jgi:ankyrin repeat protein